jgi:hypothetical protein
MGTIFYTAPEIIKNQDYDEKCDMWSLGITLFEIYFGLLPYGWNPNAEIIEEMMEDEKNFLFKKSGIPTLDILLRRLLQINPENRMTISEFYDYVTNENFLNGDVKAINNDKKYIRLYQEIELQKQIYYPDKKQPEKFDKDKADQQSIEKITDFVYGGKIPDMMSFPNENDKEEEIFNNIIYYDSNIEKHKKEIYKYSDKFEKKTNGAFILCTSLNSLNIIKDEILRYLKYQKKVVFNLICNGKAYESNIKQYLDDNKNFKNCINKLCIYCQRPKDYIKYKNENTEFISYGNYLAQPSYGNKCVLTKNYRGRFSNYAENFDV